MDYFEKRQWIRLIICAAVVIAITLLVAGIIGGEHLTYNRTETSVVTEKGFGGDVTLHVSKEGNLIRKLVIDTPDETEGLGRKLPMRTLPASSSTKKDRSHLVRTISKPYPAQRLPPTRS